MKHMHYAFYVSMILLIMLAACAPQSTPTMDPTLSAMKTQIANLSNGTDTPAATLVAAPVEATSTSTLVPVVLSGPPMEVGSMWPYVDGSTLVAVPGGPFTMGHGGADNPEHIVTLSDFWIYQTKVTNQQYALCVKAGQCTPPNLTDDLGYNDVAHFNDPVTGVTWSQASAYCTFVHGALPTEAQWEKTARGPNGLIYPWGNGAPTCDYLNFNNCVGKTTNVTTYPQGQSYYHALDMEGNALEWVADWFNASYYTNSPAQDPLGPDSSPLGRSIRSSSYKSNPDQVAAFTRRYDVPTAHSRELGFRCVVLDPTYFAPLCQSVGVYDSAPAGNSSSTPLNVSCPKVGIGLTSFCKAGTVRVTFTDSLSPDPNAVISGVSSCTPVVASPGVFPQVYDCKSSTTATITSKCTYTGGSSKCGDHYNLNPNTGMCVWDGTGTPGVQCLPGYNYDPANMCCSVQTGTGLSFCPVGTVVGHDANGNAVCVKNENASPDPSHSEAVLPPDPATCVGQPGGTQPPATQPPSTPPPIP
jgi:formylglycine-generating enzyme required for sulfatase activity